MRAIDNIRDNSTLLILASLIFSIKPLEFLAINISATYYIEDLIYPIIFHFIIFFLYIVLFLFFLNFKKILINKVFIFLAATYYLQYFWIDLADFLKFIIPFFESLTIYRIISLNLIILISAFFTYLFFSSKNKYLFIIGSLLGCLIQIIILISNLNYSLDIKKNNDQNEKQYSDQSDQIDNVIGENIYYIILDGLVSYEYLSDKFNIKNEKYKNFNNTLESLDFKIFKNSFSSYINTDVTIGSILNMDYYKENFIYKNNNEFFPLMLRQFNPPKLIDSLNSLGYEFIFSGNTGYSCLDDFENVSCKNKIPIKSQNIFKNLLYYSENEGFKTLIRQSLIKHILLNVTKKFNLRWENDGLEIFLELSADNIVPNSSKFYFIYNLSPHPPNRDNNCNIQRYTDTGIDWENINSYSKTISCALDVTLNSVNRILKTDPTSIIVVQSDHGSQFYYDWKADPSNMKKDDLLERFSIYNSVKLPKRCSVPSLESMGQVETINLVLNCISNNYDNIDYRNKSFATVPNNKKDLYGSFFEVTENLKSN
tara:strand:+ start:2796 stop:4415 length:1620 start_codon:yes stop_codon:yes gene_type:complete